MGLNTGRNYLYFMTKHKQFFCTKNSLGGRKKNRLFRGHVPYQGKVDTLPLISM